MKNTILLHDHDTFLYTPHKWVSKHTPSIVAVLTLVTTVVHYPKRVMEIDVETVGCVGRKI